MKIKIIIANNDILYKRLSNIATSKEQKIEIINVPNNKLYSIICKIKKKERLIVLDVKTSVLFCTNILKNAIDKFNKMNIIILVIDFKHMYNIINSNKKDIFLSQSERYKIPLLNYISLISDSLKDVLEIEKNIESILKKLGFTMHFKGTYYLKDSILLAYNNKHLLFDTNTLIQKVAEKNDIKSEKLVRSDIDRSLKNMLDYTTTDAIYNMFGQDYDGRTISLKYFIDLCVRYLENKDKYIVP